MDVPRWTATRTGIVFLLMIVGGVLASLWPVWFAPPIVSSTLWLYIGLMVLWFPVLIILSLGCEGAGRPFILFMIMGIIIAVIVLAIGGPNLSVWAIEAKNCTSTEISAGQTEYTCHLDSLLPGGGETLFLQGPTGSAFVRLIKRNYPTVP